MVLRILRGAVRLHPMRLALVVLSTAMGAGIASALGFVALQAEDRIARELRSFGANIVVEPVGATAPGGAAAGGASLQEADLARVLTIFWRHNVVGLAPSLTAPATVAGPGGAERALVAGVWFERRLPRAEGGEDLVAGVVPLFPHWTVDGRWPAPGERGAAVVGRAVATRLGVRPGARLAVDVGKGPATYTVAGLLATGGLEEDEVLIDLSDAQALLGRPGEISRALVSAVTVPLDAFGRRPPSGMTRLEYEKWFCTPYVTSVARQVEEAIRGSRARPVWSIAEAEARVLSRLGVLMAILAALSLAAAALAVASTFAARVMGRRAEIALMRACGASAWQVVLLLGAEILALGALGGVLGAALAAVLVRVLGAVVFGAPLQPGAALAPLAVLAALLVAAAGAVWPLRRALALEPAPELKEAA
ncbi:ABC transporter permease [Anaeromyxobacter oryzisoli]|uniref:ABC transporter permease n=1 Tax=Anaeromyxobacter oryzisoli TaxID=2925408 RepID=UPI001F57ACF5|nr:ABC transporter permease [Anaeromyxobacter sp. SG63]